MVLQSCTLRSKELQVISRDFFGTLGRYFSVSLGVYIFILIGMYALVEQLQIDKTVSYVLIYLCAYVSEYVMTLTLVFRTDHALQKVAKFAVNMIFFLTIGTGLFEALIAIHLNYLIATLAAAIILLPLRFLANKYWVYR